MNTFQRFICVFVYIALVSVSSTGCRQNDASGDSGAIADSSAGTATDSTAGDRESEVEISGRWALDHNATATLSKKILAKKVPNIDAYLTEMRKMAFNFTLEEDGTFVCFQRLGPMQETCSGNYTFDGKKIEMNQTHVNDTPKVDKLYGALTEGRLRMIYVEQGIRVPYIFNRAD